ncbi:MAG: lytic transglycosylase domain-containing protein [Nitrospirales bacterium]
MPESSPDGASQFRGSLRVSQQHHVQPALLLAVMKAESSFNPIVISKAGAVELMQLVPETAIRHGVRNLYDANENITGGAKHLQYLLNRFHGNTKLALAAYNAGERTMDRYGKVPPYKETQEYVKKVLAYYRGGLTWLDRISHFLSVVLQCSAYTACRSVGRLSK